MILFCRAAFWIAVYLVLVLVPLFALLIGPRPSGSGFWWDLSLALGFAGTTMMAVMFFLTARFQRATAPFGIDLVYYFHRWISQDIAAGWNICAGGNHDHFPVAQAAADPL
jgi:predicted ferric reductase